MADQAWAVLVTEENFQAILSESGRQFDRKFLEIWFEEEGGGYFIRDKTSKLDCHLFPEKAFFKLYSFVNQNDASLFREIVKQ